MLPNPIIEIGFLKVHMYGVMIAIGLLCTFMVIFIVGKKIGLTEQFRDFLFYNGIFSIAFGFASASLFQAFYDYIENPEGGFNFGQKMTFMGGLIGGVVTFLVVYFILRKRLKNRLMEALSMVPSCILIAHGFGRVGCFFAGCCYGCETDSILGVKFPNLNAPVHPTQLYEAFFLFTLFAICTLLLLKKNFQYNMSVYLISYGIFRFCIEYLRADDRGAFFGPFSPSQLLSIFMVAIGIGTIFLTRWYLKKKKAEQTDADGAESVSA